MIDTAEKRRSVIDFGKGPRGAGMPIPSGAVNIAARSHVLNLYPGIPPVVSLFFFWRERTIQGTTLRERVGASSTWASAGDPGDNVFTNPGTSRDE